MGKLRVGGHIGWQQMELLHLRSPRDDLGSFKHARIIESANFNEHRTRGTLRTRCEMDSANLTKVPSWTPRMLFVGVRSRSPAGKSKSVRTNRGEEISCAS